MRLAAALVLAGLTLSSAARAQDADPWFARDKALHFDVSAGIAAAGYGVSAGWLVDARWKALAIGGGIAIAWGVDLLLGGVSAQQPLLGSP